MEVKAMWFLLPFQRMDRRTLKTSWPPAWSWWIPASAPSRSRGSSTVENVSERFLFIKVIMGGGWGGGVSSCDLEGFHLSSKWLLQFLSVFSRGLSATSAVASASWPFLPHIKTKSTHHGACLKIEKKKVLRGRKNVHREYSEKSDN